MPDDRPESPEVRQGDVAEGFDAIVFQQALQHPLPWRVESDWTEEVIASDGYCIAKCRERTHAEAIINAAKRLMDRGPRLAEPTATEKLLRAQAQRIGAYCSAGDHDLCSCVQTCSCPCHAGRPPAP